jgi:hypothetical protein
LHGLRRDQLTVPSASHRDGRLRPSDARGTRRNRGYYRASTGPCAAYAQPRQAPRQHDLADGQPRRRPTSTPTWRCCSARSTERKGRRRREFPPVACGAPLVVLSQSFRLSVNRRQSSALKRSTGPARSFVSRTMIVSGRAPTSTQLSPWLIEYDDFRHARLLSTVLTFDSAYKVSGLIIRQSQCS